MLRNRKEIAKNIVEIWVWDSKLATGSKRGNGPGSVWYLSLNTLYPSLCSSSSGYLQRLTQVYSRQGAVYNGWLNLRVALSRHRLAHLLNIVLTPTLAYSLSHLHCSVEKWNLDTGNFWTLDGVWKCWGGRLARDKARFGRSAHTANFETHC